MENDIGAANRLTHGIVTKLVSVEVRAKTSNKRRENDIKSTSMTLIQRRYNVVY